MKIQHKQRGIASQKFREVVFVIRGSLSRENAKGHRILADFCHSTHWRTLRLIFLLWLSLCLSCALIQAAE
jgi:hypothetical protein